MIYNLDRSERITLVLIVVFFITSLVLINYYSKKHCKEWQMEHPEEITKHLLVCRYWNEARRTFLPIDIYDPKHKE